MTETSSPPPADGSDAESSPFTLVAQFFVIPLAVVILAVAIFVLFGLFTREKHTPAEYLDEVVTGSLNRRWQAAYEFSTLLGRQPELTRDDALFQKTLGVFESIEEPQVRRYLALALGRFERPAAAPALIGALDDGDLETRVYAIIALGSLQDRAAVQPLVAQLRDDEASIRKTAAFALGQIGDPAAAEPLHTVAEDRFFDVRLQAAVSLAQLGDAHGVGVLRQALDPATYAGAAADAAGREMNAAQQSEAALNAIRGLVLLGDRASEPALSQLAKSDPNPRVRDAALKAIDALAR